MSQTKPEISQQERERIQLEENAKDFAEVFRPNTSQVLWKMRWAQDCIKGAAKVLNFIDGETTDDAEQYQRVNHGIAAALYVCAEFMKHELDSVDPKKQQDRESAT
jgi:hypothetical protein